MSNECGMTMKTPGPGAIALAATALLVSCSGTRYTERADDIVEPPASEARVEALGTNSWCSDFGHPQLDATVERVWEDNMQLKAAWARLEQAEAIERIAEANYWPRVEANAGVDYSNRSRGGVGESEAQASWDLSAGASYEVDVWGRFRHRANAAELEADAVEADARALAITLTSEVAEAWFDAIAQTERVKLLEAQLEVSENVLEITRLRLRRGVAGALDVAQQEQNVESIRGELVQARSLLETSQNRVAVLVGKPAGGDEFVGQGDLPDIEPIDVTVPGDLLERRPDIRSALLLLKAADERTAAAVADRLPRLDLTASIGFQAEQLSSLFEQLIWSVGAGVTQPIFEGGRFQAEIDRSEAVAEEQLYNYANTLLVAIREVRDAMVLEKNQGMRIQSLEREINSSEAALELARQQYRNGAVDYLRVLTSLQAMQEVERSLLTARRQQISNRISLCRALGGTWVDSIEPSNERE